MLLRRPGLPENVSRKWLKINIRPFRRIAKKENSSAESLLRILATRNAGGNSVRLQPIWSLISELTGRVHQAK
jgi:hypothetical protein